MSEPFRIYTLFSGSGGNCLFLRYGELRILIDAGKSARAIERGLGGLGEQAQDISAIFITHEHTDHVKALPTFIKKYNTPVYLPRLVYDELVAQDFSCECFHPEEVIFSVDLSKGSCHIHVTSFPTSHDSVTSVGYRIECDGGIFVLATDTGTITPEIHSSLLGAGYVLIEANHDENMLLMGPYPYQLKRRILSDYGHLSNAACADEICRLIPKGTHHVQLGHLSKENNTPDVAYLTVTGVLKQHGYLPDGDYCLSVASPDSAVCLCDSEKPTS